jgi:hypothetical protein
MWKSVTWLEIVVDDGRLDVVQVLERGGDLPHYGARLTLRYRLVL